MGEGIGRVFLGSLRPVSRLSFRCAIVSRATLSSRDPRSAPAHARARARIAGTRASDPSVRPSVRQRQRRRCHRRCRASIIRMAKNGARGIVENDLFRERINKSSIIVAVVVVVGQREIWPPSP